MHFPALNIRTNGIDRLMDVYPSVLGNTNENLISDGKIIWKNLRKIIQVLANSEEDLLVEEYKKRDKQAFFANKSQKNINARDDFLSVPLKDRGEEEYINPFANDWESRYYNILCNILL